MYIGFYNFYKHYNRNRMFRDPSSAIGDDLMYPFVHLGRRLEELGHKVATLDMDDPGRFDAAVFLDHPTPLNRYYRALRRRDNCKLYLVLFENPGNRPDNYWPSNHKPFEKIFTWDTRLGGSGKYVLMKIPIKIPEPHPFDPTEKIKFSVTIASQKYMSHPAELYTERVRAIRWMEQNHPDEFDLYGTLWNRWLFKGRLSRLNLLLFKIYEKFPNLGRSNAFPSWRGTVKSKHQVLRQYRFSFCYENAAFPGYFTEKMFDCWFAGCVPVYLGAPDIAKLAPTSTFIDRRQFASYQELYKYLKGMSQNEYENYLAAIYDWLKSPAIQAYGPEAFTAMILQHVVGQKHGMQPNQSQTTSQTGTSLQ
jgi:hypothetical protein